MNFIYFKIIKYNQQNIKKDEIKSDKNEVNIDSKEKINMQSIEEQNDGSNKEINANTPII